MIKKCFVLKIESERLMHLQQNYRTVSFKFLFCDVFYLIAKNLNGGKKN